MTPGLRAAIRFVIAVSCGLVASMGLTMAVCVLGGTHACDDLTWPASWISGTGLEGGLIALGTTIFALGVVLAAAFWFVLGTFGAPETQREESGRGKVIVLSPRDSCLMNCDL
jgi:hypothetical protein